MMPEHDEISRGFEYFKKAREIFAKYSSKDRGQWFSGNDNHVGDIGEYWAKRYFLSLSKEPELAPKRTSSYDIELKNGKRIAIKTMSTWNKSKYGSRVKGIDEENWDYLVAVKLNVDFNVEKFCTVPRKEVQKRIKDGTRFKWWDWLDEFKIDFKV